MQKKRKVFVRRMSQNYNGMSIIMVISDENKKRIASVFDSFLLMAPADTFGEGV